MRSALIYLQDNRLIIVAQQSEFEFETMEEVRWSPHSCSFCRRIIIDPSVAQPSRNMWRKWSSYTSAPFSVHEAVQAERDGCPLFEQLGLAADLLLDPEMDLTWNIVVDVFVEMRDERLDVTHATISWRWEDEDIAPGQGYHVDSYYVISPLGRLTVYSRLLCVLRLVESC
jgi:hypothetical protein